MTAVRESKARPQRAFARYRRRRRGLPLQRDGGSRSSSSSPATASKVEPLQFGGDAVTAGGDESTRLAILVQRRVGVVQVDEADLGALRLRERGEAFHAAGDEGVREAAHVAAGDLAVGIEGGIQVSHVHLPD